MWLFREIQSNIFFISVPGWSLWTDHYNITSAHYLSLKGRKIQIQPTIWNDCSNRWDRILYYWSVMMSNLRSESLLHKLKSWIEDYKILVTSRYEFPSFGSTYKSKTLNFAHVMIFFHKVALPPDEQSYTPDQHILEETSMLNCSICILDVLVNFFY
jgi:hypothetical protein